MKIMEQVREVMGHIQEAGREAVLILINETTYANLRNEISPYIPTKLNDSHNLVETLFGVPLQIFSGVHDFFVVDNRPWYDQLSVVNQKLVSQKRSGETK